MHAIRIHWSNGDTTDTEINGTAETIREYYLGREFNIGDGAGGDLMVTAERVEFIKPHRPDFANDFADCYGGEGYTRYAGMNCTDGAMAVAERCEAYWLIDAIGSHWTTNRKLRSERFLVVTLDRVDDDGAILAFRSDYCREEPERFKPIVTQHIEFTDFPYDYARLYLIDGVLLLPSEY